MKKYFFIKKYKPLYLNFLLIINLFLFNCKNQEKDYEALIKSAVKKIDNNIIANVTSDDKNWLTYGKDFSEKRFSTLKQISKENIKYSKNKFFVFFLGFGVIILSESSLGYISNTLIKNSPILFLPIVLAIIFYSVFIYKLNLANKKV